MNRKLHILFLLIAMQGVLPCMAQIFKGNGATFSVKGKVYGLYEDGTVSPLEGAHIRAYWVADSLHCYNLAASNASGAFSTSFMSLKNVKNKDVAVRVSYLGMETFEGRFVTTYKDPVWEANIDSIVLKMRPMTTEEAVVVGELKKMYESGDTLVFNVDAYEMPSNSVLLELVRRLPGLIYSEGQLRYMGRSIEEMRLNGESFFKNDISIALKNISTELLDKVKVYEVKNDTLDVDAPTHTVMDMETKKPVNSMFFGNAAAGMATKENRYMLNGDMQSYVKGGDQISLMGSVSDVPHYMSQLDDVMGYLDASNRQFVFEDKDATYLDGTYDAKLGKVNLSSRLKNKINNDVMNRSTLGETYLTEYTRFEEAKEKTNSHRRETEGQVQLNNGFMGKLTWSTNLQLNFYESRNTDRSQRSMYRNDPYSSSAESGDEDGLLNRSNSYSKNKRAGKRLDWMGDISHRFNDGKDFLKLSGTLNYTDEDGEKWDRTETMYAGVVPERNLRNRYIDTPYENLKLSLNTTYSHRFSSQRTFLASYRFAYGSTDEDGRYYDLLNAPVAVEWAQGDFDMDGARRVDSLTRAKMTREYEHNAGVGMKWKWKDFGLYLRGDANYKSLDLGADVGGAIHSDTVRHLFQVVPRVELSYTKGIKSLSLIYTTRETLPASGYLLNYTDYTDPLCVYANNPNLKNMRHHEFSLSYNQMTLRASATLTLKENEVSTMTVYSPSTGVTFVRPENIDGSWEFSGNAFYFFNVGGLTTELSGNCNVANIPSYVMAAGSLDSKKGVTRKRGVKLTANLKYGRKAFDTSLSLSGAYDYWCNDLMDMKNKLRNLNASWKCTYAFPFSLSAYSVFHCSLRGGYSLPSMNKAESLWSLGASYKFLKNKKACLRIEWRDVLRQSKNFLVLPQSNGWSESRTYGISSYGMVSFTYKFNDVK